MKGPKLDILLKGLTHDSGEKFEIFYCLLLWKLGLKMRFEDLLDRKLVFLDYKSIYFL